MCQHFFLKTCLFVPLSAKAVAGNEHIDSDGHNDDYFRHGIIGWALSPMWMGVDALRWAGQTVNDKALAPVVRYASPAGWLSYAVDSVKVLRGNVCSNVPMF